MGCQIGRVIIEKNEGIIIFGNVGTLRINQTTKTIGTNDSTNTSEDTVETSYNNEQAEQRADKGNRLRKRR